ncbi:MAG TPA: NUDIX domain-containing protein [bacterium]|nr:NUDIX domain-containing protein [bacterium]HPT29683.1 NUDIX domain-containing protein [bacterium]
MELIDIVDEEGNITGIAKKKVEVHSQGLWHRTAHVWCINSQNEILLQHRSKELENYPDMWDISVAGHISSGEDSAQGALREVKEEIGVDVPVTDLELLGTIKKMNVLNKNTYFDNEFSDIYLVKLDLPLSEFRQQEEEVEDLQWLPLTEFKEWVAAKRPDLVPRSDEYQLLFRRLSDRTFDYLSDPNPAGHINEDNFLIADDLFGVFDGATGLDKYQNVNGKTGGYLASAITKQTFLELGGVKDLRACALEANRRILAAMEKAGIDLKRKEILWTTTAAVIKMQTDSFEWLGVADSPIVVIYDDGTFKVLHYDDHDLPTILLFKKLVDSHSLGEIEIGSLRQELMPQIISVRQKANMDYGAINGDPKVEKFIKSGTESLDRVKYILIFSDGFLIPKKDPEEKEKFAEIVSLFHEGGLKNILQQVRTLEQGDLGCQKYPRLKSYDDATAVAIINI